MSGAAVMLSSKLIIGASPTPATEQQLRMAYGWHPDVQVSMLVFEVHIDNTVRYCCFAGGKLIADPAGVGGPMPHLTPVGAGACEALLRLPHLYGRDGEFLYSLLFHGVVLGPTPLRDKAIAAFRRSADVNALVCFVGDFAKELDGLMGPAINAKDAINIADLAGMRRPGPPR